MKIGSMFSGIGGLDLACEWALGGRTVWQLDRVGHEVRRRHWPEALQVVADVETVDPSTLPPIDVLCGGFPCQDLSQAGTGAGLAGERSGLYREILRFADALDPRLVVIENVRGLLKYRAVLEEDWGSRGYGLTWIRCRALDAGAPHLRERVFVVAERGAVGRGLIEAGGRPWSPRPWPTPMAKDGRGCHGSTQVSLERAVRPWPTATAGDAKASGSRSLDSSAAHAGTSLTDAVRPDRVDASRTWATPCATDHKTGGVGQRRGQLGGQPPGKRLNPDWVECLMGFPPGWTLPEGPAMEAEPSPRWPRGRHPKDWDRSKPWPGFKWEPARTLPDGPRVMGRPARLRGLGNAVCPQQGALALRAWAAPPQGGLF